MAVRRRGRDHRQLALSLDSWPSLVRFAAIARIDRTGIPRGTLAERMNKRASNLHAALYGRHDALRDTITHTFLLDLERALTVMPGAATPAHLRRPLANLPGLREELAEESDPDPGVRIHGAWFEELCAAGPARDTVEVLVRGEALRDLLREARAPEEAHLLLRGPREELVRQTLVDLLAIAGMPPATGMPALHILARIGTPALDEIEREIYRSPVGFRSVRILSRMLWRAGLRRSGHDGFAGGLGEDDLLGRVEGLLMKLLDQPPADPYPAHGFALEALRRAPAEWGWVAETVVGRAHDRDRPVRERMFALSVATADLRLGGDRAVLGPSAARDDDGLEYAAAVLERVRAGEPANGWLAPESGREGPTVRDWPPGRGEPALVAAALAALDDAPPSELPPAVVAATKVLVAEALLTLDESRRRRACDVLNIAHLSDVASVAIAEVLAAGTGAPRWLREHTAFVLGYLQGHASLPPLQAVVADPGEDPSVLHAAAWGIGDTCGWGRWPEHRSCVPVPALVALLDHPRVAVRQAAAYSLAVTRQPAARAALVELVNDVSADRLARALARWGVWLADADRLKHRPDAPVLVPGSRTLTLG